MKEILKEFKAMPSKMIKWFKRVLDEGVAPFEMCITMVLGVVLWVLVCIKY